MPLRFGSWQWMRKLVTHPVFDAALVVGLIALALWAFYDTDVMGRGRHLPLLIGYK